MSAVACAPARLRLRLRACAPAPCRAAANRPVAATTPAANADDRTSLHRGLAAAMAACLVISTAAGSPAFAAPQELFQLAKLTAGDPQKNPRALLRNALPINNKPARDMQSALESISEDLRVPGVRWSGVDSAANVVKRVVTTNKADVLKDVAPAKKEEATAILTQISTAVDGLRKVIDAKDKQEVPIRQQQLLALVGSLEETMVLGFPFQIPAEYAGRPVLLGRATVQLDVKLKDNPKGESGRMVVVLDGYNAPVTAGNFVDLVNKGFYNGMEIQRSDGFVIQTGRPAGADEGYVENGAVRTIPLEVMVKGDKLPVYGETLEDLGRYQEQPALPFNAFGTMAMARSEFEPNSASSQFFWLLKESELTPSSANILDGRYAVFGYTVEGVDNLLSMSVGDVIEKAKIIDGGENLKKA